MVASINKYSHSCTNKLCARGETHSARVLMHDDFKNESSAFALAEPSLTLVKTEITIAQFHQKACPHSFNIGFGSLLVGIFSIGHTAFIFYIISLGKAFTLISGTRQVVAHLTLVVRL